MTYATTLTAAQIQTAQTQAQNVASSATTTIGSNKFVFFAAFDGTNNDRSNPALAGDRQMTNVGVLEQLVARGNSSNSNVQTGYYAGPGTAAAQSLVSGSPNGAVGRVLPSQQMRATANAAYEDFKEKALNWLAADPSRSAADITTSIVGFSRGAPTGVIFSQLIAERGLTAADGTVLISPGATRVSSMLLIDPVSTGYFGNLAIPDGATNITVMRAESEKRFGFEIDEYGNDSRVETINYLGNHGDGGGFYDRGLGAINLGAQKGFFNNSGLLTAPIPVERSFDSTAPVVQHDEGKNSLGITTWSGYADNEARGVKKIAAPIINQDISSITDQANGDTTTTRTINYKNGLIAQQLVDGEGAVVLTASAGETMARDAATGFYTINNQATQARRGYDPQTGWYASYSPDKGTIVVDQYGQVRSFSPISSSSSTPVVQIDGEDYKIAANGQLYQEHSNGAIVFRDALSEAGTISTKGAGGVLTPVAYFSTEESLSGLSATQTRNLDGDLIFTKSVQTDGSGNINRTINTAVGDNTVSFTAVPGADGNLNLISITEINGQPPFAASSDITNTALAGIGFDVQDLLLQPSLVLPYVEAVDATNANGTTASLVAVTGRPDWWNDPSVISLASDATSLIALLRGGTPLAIATNGNASPAELYNSRHASDIDPELTGANANGTGGTSRFTPQNRLKTRLSANDFAWEAAA